MTPPRINKWLDLLDRSGWTFVQASIGAIVAYLATDGVTWEGGVIFVVVAGLSSVAKVFAGQATGPDDSGSLIGRPVIIPPPQAEPEVTTTTATSSAP